MMKKKNGVIQIYCDSYEMGLQFKLRIKYFKFNGKKEGEYKSYYENGRPDMVRNYKNGKVEGEYKSYYENKQLEIIYNYKDGKLEGKYKMYYDNGQIKEVP
jgi:antitoxin component YwqK of YwqJK toxin-antitoxin module